MVYQDTLQLADHGEGAYEITDLVADFHKSDEELDRLADKKTLEAYRQRIDKITGGRSPVTGQQIKGYLLALGATPRQMMRRGARFRRWRRRGSPRTGATCRAFVRSSCSGTARPRRCWRRAV